MAIIQNIWLVLKFYSVIKKAKQQQQQQKLKKRTNQNKNKNKANKKTIITTTKHQNQKTMAISAALSLLYWNESDLHINPNLGELGVFLPLCWFSFTNAEMVKAVNLASCSIQFLLERFLPNLLSLTSPSLQLLGKT